MAALKKAKHEQFAQSLLRGLTPTDAYISVGYSRAGAAQGAARLLTNVEVSARLSELRGVIAAQTIAQEIGNRNARLKALQHRWELMQRVIQERGEDPSFAEVPGGKTGLLCRDYKGKDANQEIYRVDTGLLAELRLHEKQAAQELGQWSEDANREPDDGSRKFTGTMEELLVLYHQVQTTEAS